MIRRANQSLPIFQQNVFCLRSILSLYGNNFSGVVANNHIIANTNRTGFNASTHGKNRSRNLQTIDHHFIYLVHPKFISTLKFFVFHSERPVWKSNRETAISSNFANLVISEKLNYCWIKIKTPFSTGL